MKKIDLEISHSLSLIMKGVAILMISLHNIIHRLPNVPHENEFAYSDNGFNQFFSRSFFDSPFYFIFSFLGHYGVQIFIFLSAYAFYIKKENILTSPKIRFYKSRFLRIFKPVVISVIIISILNVVLRLFILDSISSKIILNSFFGTYIGGFLHLVAIKPFLPRGLPGVLGPWWFISFILQFYILLPFLLKIKYTQAKCLFLILFSIVLNFIVTKYKLMNFDIFYTVFGHFPEIFFAFYYAVHLRFKKIHPFILFAIFVISGLLVLYCNSNFYAWFFATIPATISLLALMLLFKDVKNKQISGLFIFIGRVSIYIFLLNGITREFFIPSINNSSNLIATLLIFIYLIVTIVISYFLTYAEKSIQFKIFKKKQFLKF